MDAQLYHDSIQSNLSVIHPITNPDNSDPSNLSILLEGIFILNSSLLLTYRASMARESSSGANQGAKGTSVLLTMRERIISERHQSRGV
ncbi:Mitogen-activated protein kinase [Fusarium oxysporum f. sp. albedinis]|nr:Mitogen-activated protein kinase [Fusarium oxysporum f. sp. albedinis]